MIYLTDRTSIETDWECQRKLFWYKHYHNQGIVPASEASYFELGRQMHQAFADIINGMSYEKVCNELAEGYPPVGEENAIDCENLTWLIGMVGAFGLYIWPLWSQHYEPILVEKELVLAREPLWIACTPDLVLRNKSTHQIVIKDFKSVKSLGKSWMDHWPYAIQMHILIKAVEEELKEPVAYANITGIVKGQDRDGKLRHPYVWAYTDGQGKWQLDYNAKYSLAPTWEHPKGVLGWVEELGQGEAFQLFPSSAPIFLDNRLLDGLVSSRLKREQDIEANLASCQTDEVKLDQFFPQSFSKCRPSFGSACPYLEVCHNGDIGEDPIGSTQFIYRTPHHDMERLAGTND